jgi:hypothetical protein
MGAARFTGTPIPVPNRSKAELDIGRDWEDRS